MAPPFTRREALLGAAGAGAALALAPAARVGEALAAIGGPAGGWHMPAETVPHERTWMSWPARRDVWGSLLGPVREDVARIARTIAEFEPVRLIARPGQVAGAQRACGHGVEVVPIPNDDLWMRDIGPVFLVDGRGGLAGLQLNFNGWGGKQVHGEDRLVARRVLESIGVPRIVAPFVAEGGALEIDGEGTAVATESSIVNPNRNPGKSRGRLTAEIEAALGVTEVLWLPGVYGHDITDDHVDSLARFAGGGRIVVDQPARPGARDVWARSERRALAILEGSRDARGRRLRCLTSPESATIPRGERPGSFVDVYVNWYVCNGAVLIPAFGDPESDRAARELVGRLYPDREVRQLRIDSLAAGGGGIHCSTQQQPAVA